jgi:8-oxo-dGTP pyrophosphatase MutT (NUDIX family)
MSPPRILDPRAIPVSGVDSHLPGVEAGRLTVEGVRRCLAPDSTWSPEFTGDGRIAQDRPPAHASVLVPLVNTPSGLNVLLTRRTEHLRSHAGQISFPGGRAEPADASAAATALRETHEEVGLSPDRVEVLGQMPTYTTVTHFIVTPVVGLIRAPFSSSELALDSFEVAEAFQVPLGFLMNPANHQRHLFNYEGGQRQFLSMPWTGPGTDGVEREYFIWGATAAMLRNLYRALAAP